MDKDEIGKKIRFLRTQKKLMQYELAEKAGVSALTIVRIENGQVEPLKVTLKCIARALKVSLDELVG